MALPITIRPQYHHYRREIYTTPYASLPSALLDKRADGGAWYSNTYGDKPIRTHQIVGDVSDAIEFSGFLNTQIQMPDDMWKPDTGLSFTWTFAGCVVDPSCIGVNRFTSSLPGSYIGTDNTVRYTLPDCPSFSNDITTSGPITFGGSSDWKTPILLSLQTPRQTSGFDCNITVAHLDFVVSSSGASGNTSTSSTTGGTTATGTTLITTTDSHGSTIVVTASRTPITTSGAINTTNSTINNTSRASIGGEWLTFTTKAPHVSTLSDGSITTITGANPTSQMLADADNAKKVKMTGIIGGVLGGLALIILAAIFIWWRRRRASRRRKDGNLLSTNNSTAAVNEAHPHSGRHLPPNPPMYHDAPPIYASEQSPSRPSSGQTTGNDQPLSLGEL